MDLRDLELLILSRYPIIAVETHEEERVEAALQTVAVKLQVPLFVWTVTDGLRRRDGGAPIYDTQRPIMALANLASIKSDGVYLFKDLHRHLGEADVVRKLQDLAHLFARARRAIVLSGPRIELPAELEKLAAFFRLQLPTREELKRLATSVMDDLTRQHRIRVELGPADFDRLVDAIRGMTLFEAERALTRVVLEDLALTLRDLDSMLELKKSLLAKDGVLEYFPPDAGLAQVGGLRNLKAWLEKRRKAFTPAASEFGVSPPKGVLLLGVQGCLRGDSRILLADGRMPTLEQLARQSSDALLPGIYEVAHRVALEDGTTALATHLQIHAGRETILILFSDGRELEATPDHELMTERGWIPAGQVQAGDVVTRWRRSTTFATPPRRTGFDRPLHSVRKRRVPLEALPEFWTRELAEFIGLFAAEGNRDRYRVTLTLGDDETELATWVRQKSEKLFGILPNEKTRYPKRVREFRFDSFDVAVNLHPLIVGAKRDKAVPDPIFHLDDDMVGGFLSGLFEGDGTVHHWDRAAGQRKAPRVELKTVSRLMAQGVQLLLQRLGIQPSIARSETVHGYSRYPIYRLSVHTREDLNRFATAVGFLSERKRTRLDRALTAFRRTTPHRRQGSLIVDVRGGRSLERVYDLTVPIAERFIANGLLVHNCGKTFAAKAVAKEWGLPLLRMEPVRLYDKYIGESEKNIERALQIAERMAPCVLMVDEIEKGFAAVSSSEADGGLSRRIFGRLLGWLQERTAPVFVVATCNQIDSLPPELMRKGRFDEIFFLDLPTAEERREIFAIHLGKRKRDPARFDLGALADASEGFSGAEIEQAVVSGLYTAFSGGRELETQTIVEELRATRPLSVTRAEEVAALRAWARDRTVPAS